VRRHFTASAFVTHAGRVLLLLHRNKRLWLPPGGHVEPDEAPDAAAVREVWEEAGLRVEVTSPRIPPGLPHAAPRPEACLEIEVAPGHVHLDLVYFARPLPEADPERLLPNGECLELRWWGAAELRRGAPGVPADVRAWALRALAGARR
jgi:8-oxo-dGTP pyrophosphatase MutT (NUDIX family)